MNMPAYQKTDRERAWWRRDTTDEWWDAMIRRFKTRAPIEFAALQFECGIKLEAMKQETDT